MPCYDHRDRYDWNDHERDMKPIVDKLNKVEAMLCAIIDVLHKNQMIIPVVEEINAEEAGVTANDIAIWWRHHKVKDAVRKRKEDENKR